jgi:hypothetical protein
MPTPAAYSSLFEFDRFSGMNNVEKSFRLPVTRDANWKKMADMSEIENLDIDNSWALASRAGSSLKLSGTTIHSLWSDGGRVCLFVDGSYLHRLTQAYTAVEIANVGSDRMAYALWDDRVYMTNETYIGYLREYTLSPLVSPEKNYKLPLPAGKFIAYYRGRLYVAKRNVLYISDALCDHYDVRTGYRTFEGDITMLIALDKGLYVADGKTWFVTGAEPDEFHRDKVLDTDAIPYTAVVVNGKNIGDGLSGNLAMWVSKEGICLGDNDGKVKNLTRSRYAMSSHGVGGAVVRNVSETVHYITTLS